MEERERRPYAHLAGHKLPGATFTLPEYLTWLWHDAILVPPDKEVAHPSLGFFVAMQGVGRTIMEIFELMDATADSGVMFGELELEFNDTLRPDATYECTAEIIGVERKVGKRAGTFDKMTFIIRAHEPGSDTVVFTCTNTFVFPRAEA